MANRLERVALIGLLMSSMGAYGQWVPLVGKVRQTREVSANGRVIEKAAKTGSFYRLSNGSTLRQWTEVNGVPTQNVVGELFDNVSGTSYRLDYLQKRALVRDQSGTHMPDMYNTPQFRPEGHDSVAGVACSIFPVTNADTGRADARMCISADYGLVLRLESWVTRKDGATVRIVTEYSELTLNKEPDAKLFDLSALSVEKTVPVNTK